MGGEMDVLVVHQQVNAGLRYLTTSVVKKKNPPGPEDGGE